MKQTSIAYFRKAFSRIGLDLQKYIYSWTSPPPPKRYVLSILSGIANTCGNRIYMITQLKVTQTLGVAVGGNVNFSIRVEGNANFSIRVGDNANFSDFRYQHVGIFNAKLWRWGSEPT